MRRPYSRELTVDTLAYDLKELIWLLVFLDLVKIWMFDGFVDIAIS